MSLERPQSKNRSKLPELITTSHTRFKDLCTIVQILITHPNLVGYIENVEGVRRLKEIRLQKSRLDAWNSNPKANKSPLSESTDDIKP